MARRRSSSWGWGYYSYTTAAEVEHSSRKALADAKKKGQEFHPVIIPGNKITRTWWGNSWCQNLERYADYANRLPRGRSYVRHGAVVDLVLGKGKAQAKVQGSSLYRVEISFDPLSPALEKELGEACAKQIQNVEELVSGKFPEALKERFLARGSLFPSPRDIHFKCSCPDWASMCKHVAAVMYGIGARLDEEPLGFFDLRGIRTEDFVAKAVQNKVESMLNNAARKSNRIIGDDRLEELFGLGIGEPVQALSGRDERKETPEAEKKQGKPGAGGKKRDEKQAEAVAAEGKAEAPKRRGRPPKTERNTDPPVDFRKAIQQSDYPEKTKKHLVLLVQELQGEVFGNSRVVQVLGCSTPTATVYIKKLYEELKLIVPVTGQGKGKYRFIE